MADSSHNPFEPPAEGDASTSGPTASRLRDLMLLLVVGMIITPFLITIVALIFYVAESAFRLFG